MAESAFVVFVPEAEPFVRDLRLTYDPSAAAGIAAHVTILFPFMQPSALGADVIADCEALLAGHASFSFELGSVGRFPDTAYLEPAPAEPFLALTHALWRAFPSYPPFAGEFPTIVPHLTVSHGDAQQRSLSRSGWLATSEAPVPSPPGATPWLWWRILQGCGSACVRFVLLRNRNRRRTGSGSSSAARPSPHR